MATVGVGVLWRNIYAQLDPMNISVLSGRVAGIGVAGFLTGGSMSYEITKNPLGGISLFSPQYGWANRPRNRPNPQRRAVHPTPISSPS